MAHAPQQLQAHNFNKYLYARGLGIIYALLYTIKHILILLVEEFHEIAFVSYSASLSLQRNVTSNTFRTCLVFLTKSRFYHLNSSYD